MVLISVKIPQRFPLPLFIRLQTNHPIFLDLNGKESFLVSNMDVENRTKIKQEKEERSLYASNVNAQKDVGQRMRDIRILLNEAEGMKKFDRVVFESIVEKVIVGETNADGSPDPYKLTFVLRGIDDRAVPDAKKRYLNLRKKKK